MSEAATHQRSVVRRIVTWGLAICLALVALPAYAQDGPRASDYTFGECSRIDRETLRSEIERTAYTVLTEQSSGLNLTALVERRWVDLEVDAVIDAVVAQAVAQVAAEEGYFSRLWSGWSADKAEEFATRIADDAFTAPAFRNKIDELSTAIAVEIAQEIEADFARAASAAFLCMKAYVGAQYSTTLFSAFENRVSLEVETAAEAGSPAVDVSLIDVHGKLLGGVGLIVVTEIARRVAQKLSQKIAERIAGRIAGRVLGRAGSSLIPIAGWAIGLGLIVWDLWEGGNGALPQIEEALTSAEVKAKIRSEIADTLKNSLPDETAVVALEIAVTMLEEWEGFCDRAANVCRLAAENVTFQAILGDTPLDRLAQLTQLVDVIIDYAGRAELDAAILNGQFEIALALPASSYTLVERGRSLAPLLAWAQLAGEQFDQALVYDIPRRKQPADLTPQLLGALLAVGDQAAIDKLLALDRDELETLVPFAGESLGPIAVNMSLDEIRLLVGYLITPPPEATETPAADLAPKLASGEVTVRQLVAPPTAPVPSPTDDAPPTMQPESARGVNSVVFGSGILVLLLLTAGGVLWWRRRPHDGQDLLSSKSERADG